MKNLLFSSLLFFSVVRGMDEPAKRKLLFPLPGKTQQEACDEWWKLVRETCLVYFALPSSSVFSRLPIDVQNIIARLLFMVNNPPSFSTSEDQLFRKLLGCCITLSCKEKEWKFPRNTKMTHDGKYYVYHDGDKLIIYDKKQKRPIKKLNTDSRKYFGLPQSRNIILFFSRTGHGCLYDIKTKKLVNLHQTHIGAISDSYAIGYDQENIYVWNINNFKDIICYTYKLNGSSPKFVTLGLHNQYFVYTSHNHEVVLLAIRDNNLQKLAESNLDVWGGDHSVKLVRNNKYLIVSSSVDVFLFKEIFKIKKHNDGLISLRKLFQEENNHLWYASSENVFFMNHCDRVILKDYHENDLTEWNYTVSDPFKPSSRGKHIFLRSFVDGNKSDIIKHMLFNKKKECIGFTQDVMEGMYNKVTFNPSETIMLCKNTGRKELFCHLINGTKLVSLDIGLKYKILHQSERIILSENKDGVGKKYTLHCNGADKYLKKITHKPLSFVQIAGTQMLCSKVEQIRKEMLNKQLDKTTLH